ncbi:hypothetical protein JYU06_03045 [Desulfotalea psychrophila]|uniref:Polysaccharide chain length determinant N-terminal domain-containing protein n=1 Tax=Desulfotalea psychrophila TaxID=84980 RepID=A0ABS3AYT9_9BACT|nr:hypothetical protein [Desulfotalea psychrophila]
MEIEVPSPSMPDEINLLDVVRILITQKWIIVGITVISTVLAVGMALWLPSGYRAEVTLLPPLAEAVAKLNVPNINQNGAEAYFFKIEALDLYHELIKNAKSKRLQRLFFDENELAGFLSKKEDERSDDILFRDQFSAKLKVKQAKDKKETEVVVISLEGQNSSQIASWLNSFVDFVDKETILAQKLAFSTKVTRLKDSVVQRIESLRITEESLRLDSIARMEEAVLVAGKLGWVEHSENLGVLYEQAKTQMNMSFSLQEMPLYFRGSKALQAEIDVLRKRENSDPYIDELRTLQNQLEFLSLISQDTDDIHAMTLDQGAIADEKPVKPNRKLIVIMGFVLGLGLSIIISFARHMFVTKNNSRT